MFQGQGIVQTISEKPFTDKWNKQITLYSFTLQGNQQWFRTGTTRPNCHQGDNISFVYEQQGQNAKVDPNTIQGGGQAPQQAPVGSVQPMNSPPPVQQASGGTRDSYWKDKEAYDKEVTQPRIAYAAAQKSAVALIDIALKADILSFGNAKKADKLEMLLDYADNITGRLALKLDSAHFILEELKEAKLHEETPVVDEDAMYG